MVEQSVRLDRLAEMVDGRLFGDGSVAIRGLASLDGAGPDDLTFMVKPKDIDKLKQSRAGAALVPVNLEEDPGVPVIRVKDPYLASAIIHNFLLAKPFEARGVHPRAHVGDACTMGTQVSIGPLVVIGDRVQIGERVTVEPGTVIGDEAVIGDDSTLKANVTIAKGCVLGKSVIIHSGTVIGSDGYGYATDATGNHVKRPQVGIVRIDDDVEIGANVCVDRGAFGDTWIKSGVKIDNQVQVAHNVVVGENSLLVAQVGIAGSTTLGRNVVLGGKAAIKGHVYLEDQVMVAAGSGVHTNLSRGAVVGGMPAIPVKKWAKACSVFARLPELYSDLRRLKKEVAILQEKREKE